MDTNSTSQHISQKFDQEMESLRNKVLKMGGLVEQQISGAITALQDTNAHAAEKIIHKDHKVNAMEVTIDEACTQILARRQPAASDLRMVIAVIKTITDLERIGDRLKKLLKWPYVSQKKILTSVVAMQAYIIWAIRFNVWYMMF